jgi:hypothetical protein
MPTSPYGHLETFVGFLMESRPRSILDIGLGNGKLGFLARDCLDVMLNESYHRSHWKVRIDGIEAYGDYIQDHQRAIYDTIHIGDAFDVIERLDTYDLIILGDVLEHFEKDRAWAFFDKCIQHAGRHLAVFIPLGKTWQQPAIYGNSYETHRSSWFFEELERFSERHALFDYSAGPYGAFLLNRDDYVDSRIERLLKAEPRNGHSPDSLCRRLDLCRDSVNRIDLRPLSRHMADHGHLRCFLDTGFKEHYRLIAHLSTRFNRSTIFDIGTNKGYSALALSYNPSNLVVSYDIVECKELRFPEQLDRIEYRIGDVLRDPRLLASPLIMLDTDHDGGFENEFYAFLKDHNYRGWLFLDDIHHNTAMIRFWHGITEPKVDLTDLGHFSGSGLVAFGSV